MGNTKARIVLLAALWVLSALPCFADQWWEEPEEKPKTLDTITVERDQQGRVQSAGRTNWTDGYIEVMAGATVDARDAVNQAHAYAMAAKTARHLAYEKLAETISGLRLTANAVYDRELMLDSNLRTEVNALVRGARVISEQENVFADGSIWVEVTLGLKMRGDNGLIGPAIGWRYRRGSQAPQAPQTPQTQQTQTVAVAPAASPPSAAQPPYTGLIIDAGGLGAGPAMLPKIISESGEILYGGADVSRDYVVKMGLIGYQDSSAKARRLKRVGKNPLVVRAKAVRGRYHADFVLSDADAAKVKAAVGTGHDFLRECRVAAIIGK